MWNDSPPDNQRKKKMSLYWREVGLTDAKIVIIRATSESKKVKDIQPIASLPKNILLKQVVFQTWRGGSYPYYRYKWQRRTIGSKRISTFADLGITTLQQLMSEAKVNQELVRKVFEKNYTDFSWGKFSEFVEALYKEHKDYFNPNTPPKLVLDFKNVKTITLDDIGVEIDDEFKKQLPGLVAEFIKTNGRSFIMESLKTLQEKKLSAAKKQVQRAKDNLKALEDQLAKVAEV